MEDTHTAPVLARAVWVRGVAQQVQTARVPRPSAPSRLRPESAPRIQRQETRRRLMHRRAFDYSYQAFTADGARWLVDHTDIALVGIDYLSIAVHDDLSGPHDIILGAVRLCPVRSMCRQINVLAVRCRVIRPGCCGHTRPTSPCCRDFGPRADRMRLRPILVLRSRCYQALHVFPMLHRPVSAPEGRHGPVVAPS